MRKRQGCFLQRAIAVLLSAVLVVGMASNAASMTVLAEEGSNSQENANGNLTETKEDEGGGSENEGGEGGNDGSENKGGEGESGGSENKDGEGGSGGSENKDGEGGSGGTENKDGEGGSGGSENKDGEGGNGGSENKDGEGGSGESENKGGEGGSGGSGSVSENDTESQEPEGGEQESVSGNNAISMALAVVEENMIMTAAAPGEITSDQTWNTQTLTAGTYTISSGVTVTVSGKLTITGNVTINGGGTLRWNSAGYGNALEVQGDAQLTLENITLDGGNITFSQSALLLRGNVTCNRGTVIRNFKSNTGSGSSAGTKGVIAVYQNGVLNIQDGVTITGNACDSGIISLYQFDDHNPNKKPSSATVNMYGGTVAGNTVKSNVADMGVIWNWCGNLNISGGTVTAEGSEYAVHIQGNHTAYNAKAVISGGTLTGMKNGAVCAGKDSGNQSVITITGGSFSGNTAATANYGTIEIRGGVYNGTQYALSSNGSGALEVYGGEFTGGTKAYSGTISTNTDKVIVGSDKATAVNWDRSTSLNTYKYVAIGELTQPLPSHSHDGVAFTPWESADSLPTAAGNYYLTGDIVLTQVTDSCAWKAPSGTTNLCLNGHKVTYSGSESASTVKASSDATLNLYDCNGTNATHTLTSPATGENVTIQGGLITGSGQKDVVGSGIRICEGGICNLYGGSIAGFSDTPGSDGSHGAVRVEGTFHMYGGAITHNRSGCGGGVNIYGVNAHFYLHDGSISYNYADYDDGGGICINDTGSFEMTGGEIRGNRAKSGGGGIHWYNASGAAYTVCLSGGAITGNTTGGAAGGAVRFANNPWLRFVVSGGIRITGNKNKDGKESNLYLDDGHTIWVDSSGLGSGAAIGITTASAPTEQSPIAVTGHNKGDYSQYFTSDNPDYEIMNDSDTVKLILPHRHTPLTGSIRIDGRSWEELSDSIAFDLFFNRAKQAVIQGQDTAGDACSIYYYVSDRELSKAELEAHTVWTEGESVTLTPDRKCVVYAKITDKVGNTAYLSTGGLVFDATPPVIDGITDGAVYRSPRTVTVTDENLNTVTVNGEKVTLTNHSFTLEGISGVQTIVATDKAGNRSQMAVTVKTAAENVKDAEEVIKKALGEAYVSNNTTGDDIREAIEAALEKAGISEQDVQISIEGFEKTEATTEEAGSIGGTIVITSSQDDGVTDSVELDKTIPKLPKTEAEKVSEAKRVIEAVLKDLSGSNDTTKEDILKAIEAALEKAGISGDVKVSIEDFEKTDATTGKAGSIRGTIVIAGSQDDSVTDSVELDMAIPATGGGTGGGGGNTGGGGNGNSGGNQGGNGSQGGASGGAGNNGGSGGSDNSSGGNSGGTGTTAPGPGSSGSSNTGKPRVKQEKEGNLRKEVSVTGESTLDAAIETSLSKLADIVLTKEEKQQAAAGTDIKIVLDVKDASALVSAADKTVVEAAIGGEVAKGYTVGQYLDISLYKIVGNSRSIITKTNGKITVTIDVPDSLKNTDQAKTRTFAVIRVHDGKAALLPDLDNEKDTITIETDRFSTYAIVYQDTTGKNGGIVRVSVKKDGNKKSGGGKDDEPKTGDATPVELCATLSMIAGLTYLLLYFADRRHGMTEETKKEIVSSIIGWAKRGGRIRRYLALAAIFVLLVYYHSIGKKTCVEWKEVYGE